MGRPLITQRASERVHFHFNGARETTHYAWRERVLHVTHTSRTPPSLSLSSGIHGHPRRARAFAVRSMAAQGAHFKRQHNIVLLYLCILCAPPSSHHHRLSILLPLLSSTSTSTPPPYATRARAAIPISEYYLYVYYRRYCSRRRVRRKEAH